MRPAWVDSFAIAIRNEDKRLPRTFRAGLDIGGTFSDLAVHDERTDSIVQLKSLSTVDPVICGSNCLKKEADHFDVPLSELLSETALFCFDSTIGLNTLITQAGANVAIIAETSAQNGLKVSMSGKGNCYNNSAVESFFKSLKAELDWRRDRHTRRDVEIALFKYIDGFYNPRRKYSAMGWKSPVAFEQKAA